MKQAFIYSTLFVFCFYLGSCKSSQQTFEKSNPVSVEDFSPLEQTVMGNSKAVKLSEIVDVRRGGVLESPWAKHERASNYFDAQILQWTTVVEDKIHLLVDNVNGESFCTVYYFNPLGMRWDLMTQCNMWLYTLDDNSKITKRKIKRNEIVRGRVNDSICKMQLKLNGNVAGKILVRQYTLVSPYYTIQSVLSLLKPPYYKNKSLELKLQKMEPWIFQKDIPLLYGKYEILLPEKGDNGIIKSKVIKLGYGEMNLQSKKENVTYVFMARFDSGSNMVSNIYEATKVTATVSNVLPLTKGSSVQPLGIEITRWEE